MHIPRYVTTTKISILQKLCKKHNIKIKKNITKRDIINKLNRFLLKSITKSELINLYKNITKQSINKSNTKTQLINKLLYRIKSNNLKVNVNKISSYFYNKYKTNINKINYGAFGNTCEYALCKIFKLNITKHNGIEPSYINILTKSLYNIKQEFKNTYNMKCTQYIGNTNHKFTFSHYGIPAYQDLIIRKVEAAIEKSRDEFEEAIFQNEVELLENIITNIKNK